MKRLLPLIWLWSLPPCLPWSAASAAEIDARPPDRLAISANWVRLTDVDDGGGGSINYLHYLTPDAMIGFGVEHQFIVDSNWTFGSVRGAYGFGAPQRRTTVFGELHYGEGDEHGRDFDYGVGVLGLSQSLTPSFSLQIETRQIEVDRSDGNLPRLGLTYVWSPHWMASVAYAKSVSGNLGTELTSARVDYFGQRFKVFIGGATGSADPVVLNLQPGVVLPASHLKQGFVGLGRTVGRGELQFMGDFLKSGESERIAITLSFTAHLGSRGGTQ